MRRTSQNLGEAPRYEERRWDGEGRFVGRRIEDDGNGRGRIEDVTDGYQEEGEGEGEVDGKRGEGK